MEIIKSIDDIIVASQICARRNPTSAPRGDFRFEPAFVGYGSEYGKRNRPYWVLKVEGEEQYFIFDEEYEQGRWVSYFDEYAWRRADNFVYENDQKKVVFETDKGIRTITTYTERANIAFDKATALRLMNMHLFDRREYKSHRFVSVAPRLKEGVPVWVGLAVDENNPENTFYGYLQVRYHDDYLGSQFGEYFPSVDAFETPVEGAHYLLSTEYSSINYHKGCPLMAVRFNGTDFEYMSLITANLQ
jgi:hypothetical protein